ncbi:hypothetical protein V8F33_000095 [Rhypophila sp. PSN 637]
MGLSLFSFILFIFFLIPFPLPSTPTKLPTDQFILSICYLKHCVRTRLASIFVPVISIYICCSLFESNRYMYSE